MVKVTCPPYYQIFQRQGNRWFGFESGHSQEEPYTGSGHSSPSAIAEDRSVSETEIMDALLRVNGGLPGYYLANLRDRTYHYCGLTLEDVQTAVDTLGAD